MVGLSSEHTKVWWERLPDSCQFVTFILSSMNCFNLYATSATSAPLSYNFYINANQGSDIDTILAKLDNVFLCQWKVFLIKFRCYQFHNLWNSPRWCKIASSGNFPQKLPGGSFDRLQGVGDGLFIHSGLVTWGPPLLTLQVTLTCRRHLQSQHFQHHFHFLIPSLHALKFTFSVSYISYTQFGLFY